MKAAGPAAEADCPPTGQATLTAVQQQTTTTQAQATTFALQLNAADLEPTGEGDTPAPVAMSAELWSYEPAGVSSGS